MAKILLVDDDESIVYLTEKKLIKEGFEVKIAMNGWECMDILERYKPDLILLDIMMTNEDGWIVCRNIKNNMKTKDIPILIFTVLGTEESMEESSKCGALAQIVKPFKIKELLKVIYEALET